MYTKTNGPNIKRTIKIKNIESTDIGKECRFKKMINSANIMPIAETTTEGKIIPVYFRITAETLNDMFVGARIVEIFSGFVT